MKQTILYSGPGAAEPSASCGGRFLFLFGLYGVAMEWLWRLANGDALAQAAAWAVAIVLGAGLLFALQEA